MSKDIIVLTPTGRRQTVHCTPDTSILQVLEEVCIKQGFQSTDYALKHHNKLLDLTNTIRFANLPNKATLEMVETDRKRTESNVIVALMLEDGERRTSEFSPNTSLFDLITTLAPSELPSLQNPTILYMRTEVMGERALKGKTLRQLGLIGGKAILRLLDKAEKPTQANVSAVYRVPLKPDANIPTMETNDESPSTSGGTSTEHHTNQAHSDTKKNQHQPIDPIKFLQKAKVTSKTPAAMKTSIEEENEDESETKQMETDQIPIKPQNSSSTSSFSQKMLERRLNIEEEVTFLGAQKAIAFTHPEGHPEEEFEDLPDDFYELTIEEVRRLYHDLQKQRIEIENTPLITSSKKQELEKQTSERKLNTYNNVVVRVQFPDHVILQGVFSPTNTIGDVIKFIKDHLREPNKPFHIFTTPLKETLDPKLTLAEARFVPCVHMHFNWLGGESVHRCLKDSVYAKQTSSDAAGILASKYRAPSRRKQDEASTSRRAGAEAASSSIDNKVPRWFKK